MHVQALLSSATEAPESAEALAPFRIDAPLAVRECLRTLRDRCAPLVLHSAPGDGSRLPARVVSVNAPIDRIELDVGAPHAGTVEPLPSGAVWIVGFADHVKIQFELTGMQRIDGVDGMRVRALLPAAVYRRQRRDAYRVRPPGASAARCAVPAQRDLPDGTFDVLDASIGGLSLRWSAQRAPSCGERLEDCIVALPEVAPFRCDLLVRSVEHGAHGNAQPWRVGCAFEALSGPLQRAMQRFVFDVDRRSLQQRRAARTDQQPK